MDSKKIFLIVLITAIIFGGFGYFYGAGSLKIKNPSVFTKQSVSSDDSCIEKAKTRLKESGFSAIPENIEIKSLAGEVKEIKDNSLVLKIQPLEPLANESLDERIIKFNDQTKIYTMKQKDIKTYQAEMDEFNKKMQEKMKSNSTVTSSTTNMVTPPPLFEKEAISFDKIKIGSRISIISDKNIKNEKEITALEISYIQDAVSNPGTIPPTNNPVSTPMPTTPSLQK